MMAGMLPAGVFAYTDLEVNEIQTESEPQTETESETEQQAAEQFYSFAPLISEENPDMEYFKMVCSIFLYHRVTQRFTEFTKF